MTTGTDERRHERATGDTDAGFRGRATGRFSSATRPGHGTECVHAVFPVLDESADRGRAAHADSTERRTRRPAHSLLSW